MTKTYAIAIPHEGLFQTEFVGLFICYSGSDSTLGVSEIRMFDSLARAEAVAQMIKDLRGLHPATMACFQGAWAEDITGRDLVEIGATVARMAQPPYDKDAAALFEDLMRNWQMDILSANQPGGVQMTDYPHGRIKTRVN